MLLFDVHLDIAFNAVDWNRDLRMDLADIREQVPRAERHQLGHTRHFCQ